MIGQEATQELAFAAPEIQYARCAGRLQRLEHRVEPAFVEADRPFDRCFLLVFLGSGDLFLGLLLRGQPGDGIANESSLMHQISGHDRVPRRMAVKPALAMSKQFLHFVVTDPVVLLIVEDRNQYVEVRQQVAQSARCSQRNREEPARAERRHALVEFMTDRFDRIAERLEQRAEKRLSAAARDRGKTGFERQLNRHEVGLPLTSTTQGGIEPTREHHREQRRGHVQADR